MEIRQLGRSSVKVSSIIFGSWAIGGWMWGGTNEVEAIEAIQTGLDNGITTIDTAAIYGLGYSEEIVAKAIKGRREKVVLATKCGMAWNRSEGAESWLDKDRFGNPVVAWKNSRPASIISECEDSLKRLGVDVIDLYQIHWPDVTTPLEDSWGAMVKLKEQGKVRAIGVSNYNLEQLRKIHAIHPVDSLQPPYSLVRRDIEKDLIPFCQANHISVIVYSPMERGLLTGKVGMDRQFPTGDHRSSHPFFTLENRRRILDALEEIRPLAEKHGATLSQVVIYCTLQVSGITAALVGARNAMQAKKNADAVLLKLSSEECQFVLRTLTPDLIVI